LATLTVFAPTNAAFDAIATGLGTDIAGLLALPNLADILTYHVLATEVASSAITNGQIVAPLSTTNTLKLTKKANGDVFVNQAQVVTPDIDGGNGTVHVLNGVVVPFETVVDVAIDNGFTSLTTAVVTAELLPALTNPLATLTVFAPTNAAFDAIATGLGTDIAGLLALPNLADILTYHVLATEVASSAITNGQIVAPLSTTNTLKLTKKANGDVFVNQAQVVTPDIDGGNGTVHVLNGVVVPFETVVDVAIDNGFTTLTTAVVTAELLPALMNPLGTFTVFAPTNAAFDAAAIALGTDLAGILALPNLADILLYHVVGTEALSTSLSDGQLINTLEGNAVEVNLVGADVFINQAQVTLADVEAQNGVVHVINGVLLPDGVGINEITSIENLNVYPNPATDFVSISYSTVGNENVSYRMTDLSGKSVIARDLGVRNGSQIENIDLSNLASGMYILEIAAGNKRSVQKVTVK
jgi:transforming growth factor-beta-induced protein